MFAGPERHADIKHHLLHIATSRGIALEMVEFDILRDRSQDLTTDDAWNAVWSELCSGEFDFIILAPPCNTFSRARHNRQFAGPKPLRLIDYPRGFPWLKQEDSAKVEVANLLVDRTFLVCHKCIELDIGFLLEHPEQLGMAQGLVPASIWNFQQFLELEYTGKLIQAAIFQCEFGAATSKPTRLASSALSAFEDSPFATFGGPHKLDPQGNYVGPLPKRCPHGHHDHKLIGKSPEGHWNTAPSAAYPSKLCLAIAQLIALHLHRREGGHSLGLGVEGGKLGPMKALKISGQMDSGNVDPGDKAVQLFEDQEVGGAEEEMEECFHGLLKQAAWDNVGLPMVCRWQNRQKSFADGGGLNSPGRWAPEDRGVRMDNEKKDFIDRMALMIKTFLIKKMPDMKTATFRLATGNMSEAPFTEEDLEELRNQWFSLLGGASSLRVKTPYQPFYLFAVEETLRRMGDEDVDILTKKPGDNYVSGRRVGVGKPIDPAPLVFRQKKKQKKYDDSEFCPLADNYPSADEAKDIIARQFAEEEKLGWMYPLSEGAARGRFGDRLRVASLAAIPKDEHTVRVLFDGTHSVQVNNEIGMSDRLEFPAPPELAHIMEHCQVHGYGVVLSIAADIMKAHRRFLHSEEDHGLLGCRADSSSSTVWINRVGPFGVACAALHFGRLAGLLCRLVIRILRTSPCFQLLFADDLKLVVGGPTKYSDLWTLLLVWIMVGTPFSWKKFRGGVALDYVGFWTDYARFRIGLSEKRANWVVTTIDGLSTAQYVMTGRSFTELLGRLGFAAQAVPWLRPLLGPLYVWDSVLTPYMAARMPALVILTLKLLAERFRRGEYTSECWSPEPVLAEAFRTDAKCETGRIVLGGWEIRRDGDMSLSRWFSLEILPADAPWLFYKGLEVQRLSTTAELLATYAALHAFDHLRVGVNRRLERSVALLAAGTDNLANEQLSRKRLTTKLPLGLLVLQFYTKVYDNSLWIDLRWRPRNENVEADRLRNCDFSDFGEANRVFLQYSQMDLEVIEKLQNTLVEFESSTVRTEDSIPLQKGMSKRMKVETRSKW